MSRRRRRTAGELGRNGLRCPVVSGNHVALQAGEPAPAGCDVPWKLPRNPRILQFYPLIWNPADDKMETSPRPLSSANHHQPASTSHQFLSRRCASSKHLAGTALPFSGGPRLASDRRCIAHGFIRSWVPVRAISRASCRDPPLHLQGRAAVDDGGAGTWRGLPAASLVD